MADTDEEVTLEVGLEEGKTEGGAANGAAGAATTTTTAGTGTVEGGAGVTEGIAELQAKLDEERRLRIAAETRAAGAGRSAEETQRNSHLLTINGAIEVLDTQMREHKAAYSAAMASGDFDQAADIQAKMGRNSAERLNLEGGKFAIENQQPSRPAATTSTDPVEAMASGLTPKSAQWVRAHPEFARDPDKTNLMIAAHYKALANKLPNESPEYYAFVEKELGIGHSDARPAATAGTDVSVEPALSAAATTTQRRDTQPSAAPASRGTGSTRRVTLSKQEVEAARISGISNEEYARNKMREEQRKKNETTH